MLKKNDLNYYNIMLYYSQIIYYNFKFNRIIFILCDDGFKSRYYNEHKYCL